MAYKEHEAGRSYGATNSLRNRGMMAAEQDNEPAEGGERLFWLRKIAQMIDDATCETAYPVACNRTNGELVVLRARRWLLTRNEEFECTCESAGIDPGALLRRAKELQAAGWPRVRVADEEEANLAA